MGILWFLRTDAKLDWRFKLLIGLIPFALLLGAYLYGSQQRLAENPDDKLMPSLAKLGEAVQRYAFQPDKNGQYLLWLDTWASAKRFAVSLAILLAAIIVGLHMGVFPVWEAFMYRFWVFFDKIPAVSLLAILFIVFGLGEVSKIALIVIGVFPTIVLDAYLRAKAVPREQFFKAQSLGASEQEIAYRVVLPQILPAVLDTLRLSFKAMIMLLIVAETLGATEGLGYRIFVVRRYLAMDVILVYVLWMTTLAFALDAAVTLFIRWWFRWTTKEGGL